MNVLWPKRMKFLALAIILMLNDMTPSVISITPIPSLKLSIIDSPTTDDVNRIVKRYSV